MIWATAACLAALVAPASAGNAGGNQLWEARYNGPGNGDDFVRSIGVSPDGTKVFVTGGSIGSDGYLDYTTIAYDSTSGDELWQARYNGPGSREDLARSVGVSPDGAKVFVTGTSFGSGTGFDYATFAYDASSGAELWQARYDGPSNGADEAVLLSVSPNKVLVTGFSFRSTTSLDYATVAYDGTSGDQLWQARYNGPGNGADLARSLAVSPDGSEVFVTGESTGSGTGYDYATVAYDGTSGANLWKARYNGPGNGADFARSLAVSPDGTEVSITGESTGSGTGSDYATVVYDAGTGASLWKARYNGSGNGGDFARSVAVSPDGTEVFVTGESTGSGTGNDYATIAYDATSGTNLWKARYKGPGATRDSAYSLEVSPSGTWVIVTGGSAGDYATVAYDAATGAQLWKAGYNGPGNSGDSARSVAVTPDGTEVFVTGESIGLGSGVDYATVAYDAGP